MSLTQAIIDLYRRAGIYNYDLLAAVEESRDANTALADYETKHGILPFDDGNDADAQIFEQANLTLTRVMDKIKSSALPISKSMRDDFAFLETFISRSQATASRYWSVGPALERMVVDVTERMAQQPDGPLPLRH